MPWRFAKTLRTRFCVNSYENIFSKGFYAGELQALRIPRAVAMFLEMFWGCAVLFAAPNTFSECLGLPTTTFQYFSYMRIPGDYMSTTPSWRLVCTCTPTLHLEVICMAAPPTRFRRGLGRTLGSGYQDVYHIPISLVHSSVGVDRGRGRGMCITD